MWYVNFPLSPQGQGGPVSVPLVARHFDESRGAVILREAQLGDLAKCPIFFLNSKNLQT